MYSAIRCRPTTTALLFATLLLVPVRGVVGQADPCVIDDPDPGVGGRSEIVVSGAIPEALQLSGFATASGAAGQGWSVHLFTPGGANSVLLFWLGNGRPSPGTYKIVDYVGTDAKPAVGQFAGTSAFEEQILAATGFASVTGELTIVESTPTAVAGCYEFTGRSQSGSGSVSLAGTFAAKNQ